MRQKKLHPALIVVAAIAATASCQPKDSKTEGKACHSGQALQELGLRGASMPPKTVALTFDDGPGDRTKFLSSYLKKEGIQAGFFVNGRMFGPGSAEILKQLVDDGHLVGNHTEHHLSLTGRSTGEARLADQAVIQELVDTDAKIGPFVTNRLLFRPPFGDFDTQTLGVLGPSPMNKYVGPVLWDVGDKMDEANGRVADWDCWTEGADAKRIPMKECGDLYVKEIKHASRGIVLMHDPYYNDQDPEQQGTVDMVMYIVPILKQEGFTFMRVDKVPDIAALLPPLEPEAADGGVATSTDPTVPGAPGEDPCK